MSNVTDIIPAYPFVQYNDDINVTAFFDAYNNMAQTYLDSFNDIELPCWTSPTITGALLDWVALGVYGQIRPSVDRESAQSKTGPYNTVEYNTIPYAKIKNISTSQFGMSDDIFKRLLTWNFYKGDGFQFSIPWIKRRVARFIHGVNGVDPNLQCTFDISVSVNNGVITLVIPDYGDGVADFLIACIQQGLVNLPFMYSFLVTKTTTFYPVTYP